MLSPEVTASSANPVDTLSDPRQKGKGHLDWPVDWARDGWGLIWPCTSLILAVLFSHNFT